MDSHNINPRSLVRKPMSTPKPERLPHMPSPSAGLSQDILKLAESLFAMETPHQVATKAQDHPKSVSKSVSFNLYDSSPNSQSKSLGLPSPPNAILSKSMSVKDSVTITGPFVRVVTQRNGTLVHLGQLVGVIHDHSALLLQHVISLDPSKVSQALIRELQPGDIMVLTNPRTEAEQARRTALMAQINQSLMSTESPIENPDEKPHVTDTSVGCPIWTKSELLLVRIDEICEINALSNKPIDPIQTMTPDSGETQVQPTAPESCSPCNAQQNEISSPNQGQNSTTTTNQISEVLDASSVCIPSTSYQSEPVDKLVTNKTSDTSECHSNPNSNKESQCIQSRPLNFTHKVNSTTQKTQSDPGREVSETFDKTNTQRSTSQKRNTQTDGHVARNKQNKSRRSRRRRHSVEVVECRGFAKSEFRQMVQQPRRSTPLFRQFENPKECLNRTYYAQPGSCPPDPAIASLRFHSIGPQTLGQSEIGSWVDIQPRDKQNWMDRSRRPRYRTYHGRW